MYEKFSDKRLPRIQSIIEQSNYILYLLDTPSPHGKELNSTMQQRFEILDELANSESARIEFARRYSGEDIERFSHLFQ